jgi:hypothetical protein
VRRVHLLLGPSPAVDLRIRVGLVTLAPLIVMLLLFTAAALPFAAHRGYHDHHVAPAREGEPHDLPGG